MKITIYELLGLVKDGKAPKKIKYKNIIYQYDYENEIYYYKDSEISKMFFDYGFENLNDEVEILEEKKIPEKIDIYVEDDEKWIQVYNYDDTIPLDKKALSNEELVIIKTLNKVIDYLNSKGDK